MEPRLSRQTFRPRHLMVINNGMKMPSSSLKLWGYVQYYMVCVRITDIVDHARCYADRSAATMVD